MTVLPPTLKWWWGRALARRLDDPLLPERLQAQRRRAGGTLLVAAAVLILAWPSWAAATVGLLLALQIAAGYPLRRALYEERWSLAACVWFFMRLIVSAFGLWVTIASLPWIVQSAGRFDVAAGLALALVLIVCDRHSSLIVRRALRAQPVGDSELNRRFDALVAASGMPRPHFEYVALDGGVVANAVALPSLSDPGVLVTDTLLTRLTPDEMTAICAHELAHLEYYDAARMRRQRRSTIALIVAGAALAPLARAAFGGVSGLALIVWLPVLVVALAIRARHRQQNETASDLRAVALTGDAEALARALTKLHTIMRVPRRQDRQREQRATHPSLARRIHDIRATAGRPEAAIDAPVTFREANGPTTVSFEATRVCWQQAPGISQMLDYGALVELRLDAPASGAASLVAVDRRNQRWRMTPCAADLAALQAVLDRVDGRLTRDVPAASWRPAWKGVSSSFWWVFALIAGQFVFALLALGPFAADVGSGFDVPMLLGVLCTLIACTMIGIGWFRRRNGMRLQWGLPAVFVGLALVAVLNDLGGASALNRDVFVAPAATPRMLTGAPSAVFDIPFEVRTLRLSPSGRFAAVVGQKTNKPHVFTIAGTHGQALAGLEADDLAFVDDTHAVTVTARDGIAEIARVDVPSGTRDWRQRIPGLASGTIAYRAATNTWVVSGRDDTGRLTRAVGTVGGTDLRVTVWPAPPGAVSIDGWASIGASAIAVENPAAGRDYAQIWTLRAPQPFVMRVMANATCGSDLAVDRRLLCAIRDGRVTRLFTFDAETGASGGLAVIDAAFEMGEQSAPGWLIGRSGDRPVALQIVTGELVEPPPAMDDETSVLLTVSGAMVATVGTGDSGSRIRVYRLARQ